MYFALKTDCYFRHYGSIGHLIRPVISIEEVVDDSGAIFLDQLSYKPIHIDSIVNNLSLVFEDADKDEIKTDALLFFSNLVEDGFLDKGDSIESFKSSGFEYSTLKGKLSAKEFTTQLEEPSSHFLGDYFTENPYLESFHIELTSKCNERCVHCYIPHEKKTTQIEHSLMINALDQCKAMDVLTVIFSGGEPMSHPDFCEFLRYAKDLDFNVTVLSNLTLLNDEILDALKYKHASCVNVSLYSMDPIVHDSITKLEGSFKKTKTNILKLISNNVPVQINCPVMKQNKDSFYTVVEWGQNNKCSVVTDYLIMARFDHTTENLDNRLDKDDLDFVIHKLLESDVVFQENIKNRGKDSSKTSFAASPDGRVCGVAMSTLCMVSNGNVYPCAGWQQYICGNINKMSLSKIWAESPQVQYLRSIRQKHFTQCNGCADQEYCLMCMARNSNEATDGSVFSIPPITCEAAHIQHQVLDEYRTKHSL